MLISTASQQNKAWAWQILRARLLDQKMAQAVQDRRDTRRLQVKGMDRSDKVRTYNFPQDRVTDHRIGLTTTGLEGILEGEGLDYIISKLKDYNQGLRLESLLETGEDLDE
jgi:peptide chain release factor 1